MNNSITADGRHRRLAFRLFVLLPLICLSMTIKAGESANGYSLTQAFRDALARDARLQAAENRVAEARERLREVASSQLPSLSVRGNTGYAYDRNQARVTSVYEGHSTRGSLQLSQNLYTFGRLQGRRRQAEAQLAEAEYAAEEIRQLTLSEVAESFGEQIFRERILERRRAFEGLVGELEQAARNRLELETLDRTRLHQILRRLHEARAERIEAEARYRVARARLAQLTGANRPDLAPTSLLELEAATPTTLEDALSLADRQSPAVARARQRVESAAGNLAFRKAELWPTLSLEVDARIGNVGEINTRDVSGGVNLAMPLYEGGLKRSQLRGARLAMETAQRELTAQRETVDIEVRSNWNLLEGLSTAVQEFRAAADDMREVVALTESKLEAGRGTLIQQVEAQQSALQVEVNTLDGQLRLLQTRVALLESLAGLSP